MQMSNQIVLEVASNLEKSGLTLPLMELFYSLQGEGYHAGKAACFIRLAGCKVGCHWCDVKESWNAEEYPTLGVEQIVNQVAKFETDIIVITGGEPLMYALHEICKALKIMDKKTHLETSGAYPLTGDWDWICLSPKKFKAALPDVAAAADELKVVVYNKSDFDWAERYAQMVSPHCKLFLQPEWSKATQMLPLMIEYVKRNPKWRISLQTHKYMQIP